MKGGYKDIMRIFLVDYENVNSTGLQGINLLSKADKLVIFYSDKSNTISFKVVEQIIQHNIKFTKIHLDGQGTNALDFQLTTYLGVMIERHKRSKNFQVIIVSKDNGYKSAITLCKQIFDVDVLQFPKISLFFNDDTDNTTTTETALAEIPHYKTDNFDCNDVVFNTLWQEIKDTSIIPPNYMRQCASMFRKFGDIGESDTRKKLVALFGKKESNKPYIEASLKYYRRYLKLKKLMEKID